jgi:hypothetical protein
VLGCFPFVTVPLYPCVISYMGSYASKLKLFHTLSFWYSIFYIHLYLTLLCVACKQKEIYLLGCSSYQLREHIPSVTHLDRYAILVFCSKETSLAVFLAPTWKCWALVWALLDKKNLFSFEFWSPVGLLWLKFVMLLAQVVRNLPYVLTYVLPASHYCFF